MPLRGPEKGTRPIVLYDGLVFDGSGRQTFRGTVIIKGSLISDVGTRGEVEVPSEAETIDLRGSFLMPGLIDAHLHLTGTRSP